MNLLFATDGEPHSDHALELLVALADRSKVSISVLSVSSFDIVLEEAKTLGHYDAEAGRAKAEQVVARSVERLEEAGFTASGSVESGDAATEILRVAETATDLIVLGAGSERWLDAVMLGSTSTSVLHHAPCSVLIAHPPRPEMGTPLKIVVGTDGSAYAIAAAERFAALADPASSAITAMAVASDGSQEEAATNAVARVEGILTEAGFTVTKETVVGHPAKVLLATAAEQDLMVVGATGAGRLKQSLLGSVVDKLARHAPATLVGR